MTFSAYIAFRVHLTHSRVAVMARRTFVNEVRLAHSFDKSTAAHLMKELFKVLVLVTVATTCLMQVIMAEFMFNHSNQSFKPQFLFDKGIYLDISALQKITTATTTQTLVITNLMRKVAVKESP